MQKDHEWLSEFSLILQENTLLEAWNYDIDVPCIVQCRMMLWYSAPTSLDNHMLNDDAILVTYNKVISMAVETSSMFPFMQTQTQIILFLTIWKLLLLICTHGGSET